MAEFKLIETAKPNLNPKTLANYKNLYLRLKDIVGDKDISSLDNDDIIKAVNEVKGKLNIPATPAVRNNLLSLALVIKEASGLDVETLKKAIKENHGNVKTYTAEKNVELKETLPSLKKLNDYTSNLFKTEQWRPFIMNYLMMEFGVRNKDLMLEFGDNKTTIDDNKNYLILNKNSVKYIRGNYKTKSTYGDMKDTISNKKFVTAVKNAMNKENDGKYLLSLGENREIAETSLNKFVSKHTLDNIGQSKIFKIVVDAKPKKKEELSATRGTALGTVAEHYDINFKDEVGKAKKRGSKKQPEPVKEEPKSKDEFDLDIIHLKKPSKKKFKIIESPIKKVEPPVKSAPKGVFVHLTA